MWPGAHPSHDRMLPVWSAVRYLSHAIFRMTGTRPATVGGHDYSDTNVIVLTTLSALRQANHCPRGSAGQGEGGAGGRPGRAAFQRQRSFLHPYPEQCRLHCGESVARLAARRGRAAAGRQRRFTAISDRLREARHGFELDVRAGLHPQAAGHQHGVCRPAGIILPWSWPNPGQYRSAPPAPPSLTAPSGRCFPRDCPRRTSRWKSATSTGRWDSGLKAARRRGPSEPELGELWPRGRREHGRHRVGQGLLVRNQTGPGRHTAAGYGR